MMQQQPPPPMGLGLWLDGLPQPVAPPAVEEIEFTAPRWFWKHIHKQVELCRFRGYSVKIWESEGLFARRFIIVGDSVAVIELYKHFKRISEGAA